MGKKLEKNQQKNGRKTGKDRENGEKKGGKMGKKRWEKWEKTRGESWEFCSPNPSLGHFNPGENPWEGAGEAAATARPEIREVPFSCIKTFLEMGKKGWDLGIIHEELKSGINQGSEGKIPRFLSWEGPKWWKTDNPGNSPQVQQNLPGNGKTGLEFGIYP